MADLALQQGFWNHANDLAAGLERGVCDRSHEADAPAAVDEPHLPLGQRAAQRPGRLLVGGILSEAASRRRRRGSASASEPLHQDDAADYQQGAEKARQGSLLNG